VFANAQAANGITPVLPTMIVSAQPMSICPTKPAMIGAANASVRRFSESDCASKGMELQ
jgi:hypothetical protein